jgi:hypothetical protein
MERGKHMEEFFRGEVLMYVCMVNLVPLVVFARLFIVGGGNNGENTLYYWDYLLVLASVLLTIYAVFNYIFRP